MTREVPDHHIAGQRKKSGVVNAGYQGSGQSPAARTPAAGGQARGIELFGPDAEQISRAMQSPVPDRGSEDLLSQAIDMTPAPASTDQQGMMYFGPDKPQAGSIGPESIGPESIGPGSALSRHVRQPADMPIPIH